MHFESRLAALATALLLTLPGHPALAAVVQYDVDARLNSITGGTGLPALTVTAGDPLTITTDPGDLWSAGPLPRWSDADGLVVNLVATGSDDSGQPAGTTIGQDFGTVTVNGFTAPYGALVGEIDGAYQLIGTSFQGPAWGSGLLEFWYWDSNDGDNSGSIRVSFETAANGGGGPSTSVPVPAPLALLGAGFLLVGCFARRPHRRG
jgi:hypothetical protein